MTPATLDVAAAEMAALAPRLTPIMVIGRCFQSGCDCTHLRTAAASSCSNDVSQWQGT